MARNTSTPNLRFANLLQRLGGTRQAAPGVADGDAIPVVVLADFSASLSEEPVEARALTGAEVTGGAGQLPGVRLSTRGLGVVIQDFFVVSASQVQIGRGVQPLGTGTYSDVGLTEIGGVSVRAVFSEASDALWNPIIGPPLLTPPISLSGLRWYVQPGEELLVIGTTPGQTIQVSCVFREVA